MSYNECEIKHLQYDVDVFQLRKNTLEGQKKRCLFILFFLPKYIFKVFILHAGHLMSFYFETQK